MDSKQFLSYWGWKNLPWNEPIALERLYWQEHTQALATRLLLSLQRTASLLVLTAPPGHGKSTLGRWLYRNIDQDRHDVAFFSMLHTETSSGWLMSKIAQYLGLDPAPTNPRKTLVRLQESRLHQKILTFIIDDAHKLKEPEALDEILALLQVQSIAAHPVNFVLLGNPRLTQVVQATEGCQHRLALHNEIPGFDRHEIVPYLMWRLDSLSLPAKLIGAEVQSLLIGQAPVSFAGLESLLEGALIEAFMREQRTITVDIVQTVMHSLRGSKGLAEEQSMDAVKIGKPTAVRRKSGPTQAIKSSGGQSPTLDLNSLYYKSSGGHDPEDS